MSCIRRAISIEQVFQTWELIQAQQTREMLQLTLPTIGGFSKGRPFERSGGQAATLDVQLAGGVSPTSDGHTVSFELEPVEADRAIRYLVCSVTESYLSCGGPDKCRECAEDSNTDPLYQLTPYES